MHLIRNLCSGKRKYLFGLVAVLSVTLICVAFSVEDSNDFDTSKREILLRRIGHEILLQSGDSTSRVLPIEKIAENEFQIRFEHDFTFHPALLVNSTRNLLANDPLATEYIVKVLNDANSSVVYGFAISRNKKEDVVSCIGRKQPKASYVINIKFKPTGTNTAENGYLLGGLSFFAFVGFMLSRSVMRKKTLPDSDTFRLGSVLFDAKNRKLTANGTTTDLTATENRVLLIFALSPDEIIERSRLQKEIWEDEGVIVGRSLDMFISKLRKKLELDLNVKIVSIRGKGYRLEISV